jgi:hypothetical protein
MGLKSKMMGLLGVMAGAIGFGSGAHVTTKEAVLQYRPGHRDPSYIPGRRGRSRPHIRSKATGRAYSRFDLWLLKRQGMDIQSIRRVFGQTGAQWAMAQ